MADQATAQTMSPELLKGLSEFLAARNGHPIVNAAAPMMPFGMQPAGQPMPAAMMQPMQGFPMANMGQMPQPSGVAVPINIHLPDGRELTIQLTYGPEVLGNLQMFGQMLMASFGQALKAYFPRQQQFGGGGFGGGYGGGFGRGRRW